MEDPSDHGRRDRSRKAHNEEFLRRLYARRPDAKARYEPEVAEASSSELLTEAAVEGVIEEAATPTATDVDIVLESIVRRERPVLFVKQDWIDKVDVTAIGAEAKDLIDGLDAKRRTVQPLMPLIGRIDVVGFPGTDFVGTGWFVDTDVVMTNRHVASLIARWDGRQYAFARGVAGKPMSSSVSTLHEFDDIAVDVARVFAVTEVLYIELDDGPDIAFLRVKRRTDGARPDRIAVARADVGDNVPVFVVGYPARAPTSVIPNQELMHDLYRGRYDVKRAAPGFTMAAAGDATRHDCTTLGGNSGSVVLGLASGEAVGLHFAGLYQESNYAVRASLLADYVDRKRWLRPPIAVETRMPPATTVAAGTVTVTVPLTITVSLGQPASTLVQIGGAVTAAAGAGPADAADAETAAKAFWNARPDGVIAVRVGFDDAGGVIGDRPFIAASAPGGRLADVRTSGPTEFRGFAVRYLPATLVEQIDALPVTEAVGTIAYDDDARAGAEFSLDPVDEPMTVRVHVGPEYSWDELAAFLSGPATSLMSAIYEFQAPHIKDAIEARLDAGVSLTLVMDSATFAQHRRRTGDADNDTFDPAATFAAWKTRFDRRFDRVVAPEGRAGLVSDAYHIKVTVRDDTAFWLSSGNWKKESSQPLITPPQRNDAAAKDLPGNREWHVVIENRTLAARFRKHIDQDFKRSRDLGAGPLPRSREAADTFVDVPIEEEAVVPERRPASRLLAPRTFARQVKVAPLLTPDHAGAVYAQAVLALIRSATDSLLFQIPYISMPSNPTAARGFIDELIDALTAKLKTLRDARVILRAGGSRFSAPTHTAWFLKSKGVAIGERLRQIQNHHTKGMIVDGKRVLLGSHNWSKSGVTLNRDASLIFEDAEIAAYYAEAFEIDWARANPITPRRFTVRDENAAIREAVGAAPPPGFERVRLSELIGEED
jgi:phosphatidylserine/phosphatidylglycerophosphate/cardiolipin synthase-like enzyme